MNLVKKWVIAAVLASIALWPAAAMAGLFDMGGYVAKVDGATVTKKDFDESLKAIINIYKQRFGVDLNEEKNQGSLQALKKKHVEEMVLLQVAKNEAGKRKLSVSGKEVETKLGLIKDSVPKGQFEAALKAQGITEARLKDELKQQILLEKLLNDLSANLSVSESKVKEFYDKNTTQFSHPEQVRASHILIMAERAKMADKARLAKKDQAEAILKRVKAGEDFAKLAKENSEDPGSKMNGGDLGFFDEKTMVTNFSKAAFGMKPGGVSDVVETEYGYHIIKTTDRRPAGKEPYETVKDQIRNGLLQQEKGAAFQKWLLEARSKAKVEIAKEYQFPEPSPTVVPEKK